MIAKGFEKLIEIENGYMIEAKNASIKVIVLTDEIIRVRVSFDRKFVESSYALVTTAWDDNLDELFADERKRIEAAKLECTEDDKKIVFKTKKYILTLRKATLSFTLEDIFGDIIYKDLKERAFDKDYLGRVSHYSLLDVEKDHFYGFGEKTGHLDKKGRRLRMNPKDAIGHNPETGEPLYKHIPFYIRINEDIKKPLGLFYNNSYDAVFDMCNEISGYWDRYTYYQAEGGDIDLFFIGGESIKDVIDNYTYLTGRSAMPTKQEMGFTASTMYYAELEENCDEEIYKVIKKHFDEKIYIDNFWLASGYSSGEEDNLRYTFNWNKKRFPNPEEFFEKMSAMGINVIPNMKPGILPNHPYMKEFVEADAFVKDPEGKEDYIGRWWGGYGKFVDFTKESGRKVWGELLKRTLLLKGSKTVWNDNCEYDGVEDRLARVDNNGQGGNMAELKIIHSNMMAYVAKKALAEVYPNERPYIINRAGFAGIQRYAQVWGGDNLTSWNTLKYNIATIIGMGLSGVANMGCDIGGFAGGAPEGELLLRWIQSGIFQPRFCMNSANNDNTVTQAFMYDEYMEEVREAYALRYKMIPYMYSLMREANIKGTPVMRPLFMEFPDDTNTYNDKNLTFMLGSSVLVANVFEKGADIRKIYLPEGAFWYDINDNFREYQGGQTIYIDVNSHSIPMFLRDSGIFFTTDDIHQASTETARQLDFTISAKSDVEFIIYDDDGHSKDYEKGKYLNTSVKVKAGDITTVSFEKSGDYEESIENITLKLVSKKKGAYYVSADDKLLKRFLVKNNFDEATEGWYYNLSDRTIMVKAENPKNKNFDIKISTEKFDLIGMVLDNE